MIDVNKEDYQLVERVKKGDKRAFDLLITKYQNRVIGLIGGYIHSPEEVEDVVQESFIKAYRAIDKFRGDCSFYTWIYRIAVNTAKNHMRLSGNQLPEMYVDVHDAHTIDSIDTLNILDNPEGQLFRDEIENIVHKVLSDMPDDLRVAVMLREFDGRSYEEIALLMKCPVGTVRSRIFRARQALDEQIEPLVRRGK